MDIATPPTRIGPYHVGRLLGVGGMGEVYEGYDDRLDRPVALKRLRPDSNVSEEARARFRNEAQTVARLHHNAIVQVFDWVETIGGDWIVMELAEGRPLLNLLKEGNLDLDRTARLARDIASGLAAAHSAGIVHRDLKAANIMVTDDDQAKILDFGIAKRLLLEPESGLTRAGHVPGTLNAMSPEQARGRQVDHRSDLFSLGTLLYQMTTRRKPFHGSTPVLTLSQICTWRQKPASELEPRISPALSSLIDRLLEKDPCLRPQSAQEVVSILDNLVVEASTTAGPEEALAADPRSHQDGNTSYFHESTFQGNLTTEQKSSAFSSPTAVSSDTDHSTTLTVVQAPRFLSLPQSLLAGVILVLLLVIGLNALSKWRGQAKTAAALASINSIVAMPGQVQADLGQPYWSDAIPHSLTTRLDQVEGLEVRSPPTSLDTLRIGDDAIRIAQTYGVDGVIRSTVYKEESGLVFSFQLVHVLSQELLWSREYRGPSADGLLLAQRAAADMHAVLRPTDGALDRAQIRVAEHSRSNEAALLLEEGRYYANLYRNQGQAEDRDRAQTAFEAALDIDPKQADAAAEIAALHAASLPTGVSILEVSQEIRSWAERALALDPHSSSAWAALSQLEGGRKPESYHKKLEYALKAVTYGPKNGYALRQLTVPVFRRSLALALAVARRSSHVDPLVLISPLNEALCLTGLGRAEEGLRKVDQVLGVAPDMPFALIVRANLLSHNGFHQQALEMVNHQLEPLVAQGLLHPAWVAIVKDMAHFGLDSSDAHETSAAQQLSDLARGLKPFPRWQQSTMSVPVAFVRQGRLETAIDVLQARSRLRIVENYDYLVLQPDLEPLRRDPRFQEVLQDSRQQFEDMLAILEEARAKGELPGFLKRPLADLLAEIRRATALEPS